MSPKLPMAPTVNYPGVNRCVYCGRSGIKLTREHIVPRGLHGNLVLPSASCEHCAKVTSEMERRVLRGFMERGRRAMGISSQHKRRITSPSIATKLLGADGETQEVELPFEAGLHVVHLPVFMLPLRLGGNADGRNPSALEVCAIDTLHLGDVATVVRAQNAVGVQFDDRIDLWAFARMLGKVAHCYYIAETGWFPLQESPVLPVLMGKSDKAREWIGCIEHAPLVKPGSKALHLMDITDLTGSDGSVCSVVRIKLFSPTSGPTYAVVTRVREGSTGVV
jgi:hypothetical protein